jgi:16S rRNA (cytosine1402-N4)-methyltransferase
MPADPHARGYHLPVLLAETVSLLEPAPGRIFVDGTLGGGGHTEALLQAGATVVAIDQDPEALAHCAERLSVYGERFRPVQASYHEVASVLDQLGIEQVDGALLDLGVSSHQLDTPSRGFSFMNDGPLDMRMSPTGPVTASDLVNTASEDQLARIFREYGEEPAARRVAARLVKERAVVPFTHTLQFADLVASVIPRKGRSHPATRIFQALRIAVNRELEVLSAGLAAFTDRLAPGARFGVITFHSLEDRATKVFFKERAVEWLDRPEWPAPRRNPAYLFKLITNRPVIATDAEQKSNPRSRSAKLRVVERIQAHAR